MVIATVKKGISVGNGSKGMEREGKVWKVVLIFIKVKENNPKGIQKLSFYSNATLKRNRKAQKSSLNVHRTTDAPRKGLKARMLRLEIFIKYIQKSLISGLQIVSVGIDKIIFLDKNLVDYETFIQIDNLVL